jgi:hypothetical protein
MRQHERWQLNIGAAMLVAAVAMYAVRYWVFPGSAFHSEMWRFLVGDVAFLFVQVLLLTFFIDRLLKQREREAMLQKLNMVIGAFYSEIGTKLMGMIASYDLGFEQVRDRVLIKHGWTPADYADAKQAIREYDWSVEACDCDLRALKAELVGQKPFLLSLLANQNLLEHEAFTELLWAVTHLAEELELRPSLSDLSDSDQRHIAGDINRAYVLLVSEWLDYMRHVQTQYPYLFSLAVRTNPLDPKARIEVTQ